MGVAARSADGGGKLEYRKVRADLHRERDFPSRFPLVVVDVEDSDADCAHSCAVFFFFIDRWYRN